jgi:capsular polysaccharide export protein
MKADRSFLFLQGNASRFFGDLGRALRERGYEVRRINFHGGDRLFWPLGGAVDYRLGLRAWPRFLESHLDRWGVTDILLFGDCRPLHGIAVRIAKARGIRVHVFDEGYLRPNWITMDLGGTNGHSSLPRDPAWYRLAAGKLPPWQEPVEAENEFFRRSVDDVFYYIAMMLSAPLYPGYRTHRPWNPLVEYAGWLYRFARAPAEKRRIAAGLDRLSASRRRYFFFPLQLDCDSQIRHHSSFGRMAPAIRAVLGSFAKHAPPDCLLVVKEHPLDNCLTNWRRMTARIAEAAGIGDRVIYFENGPLEAMIAGAEGVVTVNSTSGFLALQSGKPLIALGKAIYAIPGITDQRALDAFWTDPQPPDSAAFDAFRRVAVARTQINGGFFSRRGVHLAVAGAVKRLEGALTEATVTAIAPGAVQDRVTAVSVKESRTHVR